MAVYRPSLLKAVYRAGPIAVGPSVSSEVTLINQSIPGGLMGTTGMVRCTVSGLWLNNHASAARNFTLRVYAGGTKIYDAAGATLAVSTSWRGFVWLLTFANLAAQNSNQLAGLTGLGGIAATTTGYGTPVTSGTGNTVFSGIGSAVQAIDTSADWVFKVTVQLSTEEATLEMDITSVLLEVL